MPHAVKSTVLQIYKSTEQIIHSYKLCSPCFRDDPFCASLRFIHASNDIF
jgi:hypothetical protein